jgi:hypothetical protein
MVTVSLPLVIFNPGIVDVLVAQVVPVHVMPRLAAVPAAVNVNKGLGVDSVSCAAVLVTLTTVPLFAVTVIPPLPKQLSVVAVVPVEVKVLQIHW